MHVFFLSSPLTNRAEARTQELKLEAGIPQVFCHRVCLLIQSASMDPFLAHYKDQDWKKNTEGTFRERWWSQEVTAQTKTTQSRRAAQVKQGQTCGGTEHAGRSVYGLPVSPTAFTFLSELLAVRPHCLSCQVSLIRHGSNMGNLTNNLRGEMTSIGQENLWLMIVLIFKNQPPTLLFKEYQTRRQLIQVGVWATFVICDN